MNDFSSSTETRARLLIVDDSLDSIRLLQALLSDSYRLAAARSGEEGIARADIGDIDLILLDVNMAGIDGYETCRRLKANSLTRDIPVVFITGADTVDDESRAFAVGGVDFIAKPFNAAVVRARVHAHVTLKRQRDHLTSMLMLDNLTGIPNRAAFNARLEQEWQRALRYQRALGLLMIDVDHFKTLNDYGGHLYGDECLRQVARAITSNHLRISDFAARYAGDEFACILPETSSEGTLVVGRRVLDAVRDVAMAPMPHSAAQPPPRLTISVGTASLIPVPGQQPSELVALADKKLYVAKEQGRDSVQGFASLHEALR